MHISKQAGTFVQHYKIFIHHLLQTCHTIFFTWQARWKSNRIIFLKMPLERDSKKMLKQGNGLNPAVVTAGRDTNQSGSSQDDQPETDSASYLQLDQDSK